MQTHPYLYIAGKS